jgi:hypothetical protein
MEAVPLLISVGCLIGFFLFVFGVAGTELFGSAYHQVCMDQEGIHEPSGYEAQDEYGCGARQCPANYTCTVSCRGDTVVNHACMLHLRGSVCMFWDEQAVGCCLDGLVPAALHTAQAASILLRTCRMATR